MNTQESRFMRIRRFSEDEIASLHDVERTADLKWRSSEDAKVRGDGWLIAGAQKIVALEVGKEAFWNQRITEDDRSRAIDAFVKSNPVKRAFAMLTDKDKTEIECQHGADWVVWKLAPMIGTAVGESMRKATADQ